MTAASPDLDEDVVRCATCGAELDGDPDEDPIGDAGRPICGECRRGIEFDNLDLIDGELDGNVDPDD